MRKMLGSLVLLATCGEPITEGFSEKAIVRDKSLSPMGHDTIMVAQYRIVFDCQHGRFEIQGFGTDSRAANLYRKLEIGQAVRLLYGKEGAEAPFLYRFRDAEPIE